MVSEIVDGQFHDDVDVIPEAEMLDILDNVRLQQLVDDIELCHMETYMTLST